MLFLFWTQIVDFFVLYDIQYLCQKIIKLIFRFDLINICTLRNI